MKVGSVYNTANTLVNKVDNSIVRLASYPKFTNFLKKLNNNEDLFQNIIFGTLIGRQIIKMGIYTSMSWFNKQLPPEQRRFAAAWDFFQSLFAVGIMGTIGTFVNTNSKKWAENLFKASKNDVRKFELAKLGFRTALTVIGIELIAYRIVLPLVGTPIAKKVKEKYLVHHDVIPKKPAGK